MATAARNSAAEGREPATTTDMRRLLENREVEAVFIATPDHWHAPAAILSLDAGKHVAVVSPELHKRDHVAAWQQWRTWSVWDSERVHLCTDHPTQAEEVFA